MQYHHPSLPLYHFHSLFDHFSIHPSSFCQPSTTATTTSTFTTKTTPLLPQRTTQSYAYYPVSQDEEEVNDDSDDIIIAENLETSTLPKNTIVTTEPSTTQAEPEDVYFEQSATQPSLSTRQGASRPTFRAPQEPRSLDERLNLLSDVTPVPRSASSSSGPSSKSTLVAFWARSLLPPLLLLFWERRAWPYVAKGHARWRELWGMLI